MRKVMTPLDPSTVATMQGRELDAAIHRRVMGSPREKDWRFDGVNFNIVRECPHYSTDPAAFFAVLEKVREAGLYVEIIQRHDGSWVVMLHPWGGESVAECCGYTLPLAFARAALLTIPQRRSIMTTAITPERLAELDAMYAATTPGTRHLMAGMPTNVLTDGGLRVARCDFDGTVNAEAECNARGIVALHNSYPELSAALRTAWAKLTFLEDKGITVGLMKTSDKPKPYLAYVVRSGSELDDMPTLRKMMDAERERDRLAARLAEAEELLRQAMLRRTCYCESASCHCGAYRHSADFGKAAAAFLASTEPAK